MPTPSIIKYTGLTAAICALVTAPLTAADPIDSTINPSGSQGWNTAAVWGGTAPAPGNDYRISTGLATSPGVQYVVNGISWNFSGQVRDVADSEPARSTDSQFGGDRLILQADTRVTGKAAGGSTQTANLVLDGGFYQQSPSNVSTPSSVLAGTITFGSSNIGLLALTAGSNGSFTWTIHSTVVGNAGDTLQLTMGQPSGARINVLNFAGDLSGFAGTLYMGVSASGVNGSGTGAGSSFHLSSDALSATLQLDMTTTNFLYDLGLGNVTVGALSLGSGLGTPVGAGVYDALALNTLAEGSYFTGMGTITVVPEPSTTALGVLALLSGVLVFRSRQRRKAA